MRWLEKVPMRRGHISRSEDGEGAATQPRVASHAKALRQKCVGILLRKRFKVAGAECATGEMQEVRWKGNEAG